MDIQSLYPNNSDFVKYNEHINPEIFNYICVHGYQLFIRVNRKKYDVLTARWYPLFADPKNNVFTDRVHIIGSSRSFDDAMILFKNCADELIRYITYGRLF